MADSHDTTIPISLRLPSDEAKALAQLVKRLDRADCERLSSRYDGGEERDAMIAGVDKLQRALADAGFRPRWWEPRRMPVHINADDDGFSALISYEDATHIVITIEIPKTALRQGRSLLQALLAIAVAEWRVAAPWAWCPGAVPAFSENRIFDMTDTSVIAPLRSEIKIKDPTGPLRSRRARQKRKAKTAVSAALNTALSGIDNFSNEIKVSDTVSTSGSSVAEPHGIPWSAWPLAVTTIALMGMSLTICQMA
jgi:hypothetical protein